MELVQKKKQLAKTTLDESTYNYFSSGTGNNTCFEGNLLGFQRLRIVPSYLSGLRSVDVSTKLAKRYDVAFPIGISPTGTHALAHPDAEVATARAAADLSICMILSTWSSVPLEQVSAAVPNGLRWYQMYIYDDPNVTLSFVRKAERAGYKGIVLTIDSVMAQFNPVTDVGAIVTEDGPSIQEFCKTLKLNADWSDIDWLKSITDLPVILKSVLSVNDAQLAAEHNVDAIIVSNRGGRQMDALPSTIDMLPHIVDAVGHRLDVYMDGGVRSGFDAFKAVAIGAKAVFVGRPAIWGLVGKGADGVKEVLQQFKGEFRFAMSLAGCETVSQINRSMVTSVQALQSKI